jgi:hypothetical protein
MFLKLGKLELLVVKNFIRRSHDAPIFDMCRTPDGIEGCIRGGYYFAFSYSGGDNETNNRSGGGTGCCGDVQEGVQG